MMSDKPIKTYESRRTHSVNLVVLAKKYKEAKLKKLADSYNTDTSSCARVRSAGNGL